MTPRAPLDRLKAELWPEPAGASPLRLYAILDGARDDRIYPAVLGCGLEHCCLYAGALPREMLETAPYLIALRPDAPFTEALLRDGWGDSWGIFVSSTATLEELRRHFRKLLRVQDETGKTLIFRFYDPRVMRVYLPTCTEGELRAMFGPAAFFLLEAEDPRVLLRLRRAEDGLDQGTANLGE